MTEQQQNEQEAEQSAEISKVYGAKLKAARLSLQLTVDNVAQELNLHKNIILSLEEMDEQKLPTSAFIKGYIRSYAKLVDLDGDELVNDYAKDEIKEEYNFVPSNKNTSEALNKRKSDEPGFKVTIGVFVAIAILFIILSWQSKNQSVEEQNSVVSQAETLAEKPDSNPLSDITEAKTQVVEEQAQKGLEDVTITLADETATQEIPQATAEEEKIPATEKEMTEPPSEQSENRQATDEILASVSETEKKQAAEKPLATGKVMTISVSDDAWMEIRNQEGKRLFTNVLASGKTIRFDSSDLYRLIIGRAGVVKINFEGQDIDFSAYQRRNGTARFILSSRGLAAYQRSPQAAVKVAQPKPNKTEQSSSSVATKNPPIIKTNENAQQPDQQQEKTTATDNNKTELSTPTPPPSEIVTEDIE